MKNLENYGVQELNTKEMSEVEGGSFWSVFITVALFIIGVTLLSNNNDNVNW